jgi:hypothetical protein
MGKPKSKVVNAIVPGPLEQYAPWFQQWLLGPGYGPLTTVTQLQLIAHVSRWLKSAQSLAVQDIAALARVTAPASRRRLACRSEKS